MTAVQTPVHLGAVQICSINLRAIHLLRIWAATHSLNSLRNFPFERSYPLKHLQFVTNKVLQVVAHPVRVRRQVLAQAECARADRDLRCLLLRLPVGIHRSVLHAPVK